MSQFRTRALQLYPMCKGQFAQDRPAGCRKLDPHLPFVLSPGLPRDSAFVFEPVDQLDGAVMLDEEPGGNLSNTGLYAFRQAMHG